MQHIIKYPRTPHLEGSCLQIGDDKKSRISLSKIPDGNLIWEEKLDGANTGISFSGDGVIQLQSRGHFLMGGVGERQFDIFKSWSQVIAPSLWNVLGTRYIMYGEWVYAKHSIFYDALPHYFFEFDIFDRESKKFLSTSKRHEMLANVPVQSVPVIRTGQAKTVIDIEKTISPSLYKTDNWQASLEKAAHSSGVEFQQALLETDNTNLSEGLYFKLEDDDHVIERYKFVRAEFLQTILQSGSHWKERPIIPNQLSPGIDLFENV